MINALLIAKVAECEEYYSSEYGSKESVPDWLIVQVLNRPSDEHPLTPGIVPSSNIRNILIRHGDFAKIQLQAESEATTEKRQLALSAIHVFNLTDQIDFTDPFVLSDFQGNMQQLLTDGTISTSSVSGVQGLIYQSQSWAKCYNIVVTPEIISEVRAK